MNIPSAYDINDDWSQFMRAYTPGELAPVVAQTAPLMKVAAAVDIDNICFLNISTKTKILYINCQVDIARVFWLIPIVEYGCPETGAIKKQMKFVARNPEEVVQMHEHLAATSYYTEHIIKQIDNPDARNVKFRDERKITVGLSKKDVICCRGKVKNAFYNCFSFVLRLNHNGVFREIHVKVFNTGKMEVPGVADDSLLEAAKPQIMAILAPHLAPGADYDIARPETSVLINSNFNCGFFINREAAHTILRSPPYNIEAVYDPCSYPGIKCKFYYDNMLAPDDPEQTGCVSLCDRGLKFSELTCRTRYTEVSFMLFRTGSGLIVGNCTELVLRTVFAFIRKFISSEQAAIRGPGNVSMTPPFVRAEKIHKKTIWVSPSPESKL